MGTNFFAEQQNGPDIHLGKRSMGWQFTFNGSAFQSLWDVQQVISRADVTIVSERGEELSPDDFRDMVQGSLGGRTHASEGTRQDFPAIEITESDGFEFVTGDWS
jgi:hypothetical protein